MPQDEIGKLGEGYTEEVEVKQDTPERVPTSETVDVHVGRPDTGVGSTEEAKELEKLNVPINPPEYISPIANRFTPKVLSGLLRGGDPNKMALAISLDKGRLKWAHQAYFGSSPQQAAMFAKIARENGVPYEYARKNHKLYNLAQEQYDIYKELTATDKQGNAKYPELYNWIVDPAKMAVGKHYIKSLVKINELYKEQYGTTLAEDYQKWDKEFKHFLQKNVKRTEIGIAGTTLAMSEFLKMGLRQLPEGYNTRKAYEMLEDFQENEWFKQTLPGEAGFAARVMGDIVTSLPGTLVGMGMSAAGAYTGASIGSLVGPKGAVVGGVIGGVAGFLPIAAGALRVDLKDIKGLSEEQKDVLAIGAGVMSASLERLGFKWLFDKKVRWGSVTHAVLDLAESVGTEGATEALQGMVETFAKKYGLSMAEGDYSISGLLKQMKGKWGEESMDWLYQGFIGTIMGGAFKFAEVGAQGTIHLMEKKATAERNKKAFDKLKKIVEDSDMADKAPDELEDAINNIAEGTNAEKNVYVPVSKIEEYYHSKEVSGSLEPLKDIKDFLEKNGVTDSQVKKAEETGGYVEINKGKYLAQNDKNPILDYLNDHIRLTPDGASVSELKNAEAEIAANIEKVEKARREAELSEPKELLQNERLTNFRKTLIKPKAEGGLGFDAKSANAVAAIYASRAMVAESTYEGTTADQWLTENVPDVVRGTTGDFRADRNYMLAGLKSKTANVGTVFDAAARLKAGEDWDTVRKETGWFKGVDNKWYYEIDDSKAVLRKTKLGAHKKGMKLDDVSKYLPEILDHKELYEAYPFLKSLKVTLTPKSTMKDSEADYSSSLGLIRLVNKGTNFIMEKQKGSLLHEIQHAVQDYEGFARGTNLKEAAKIIAKRRGVKPSAVSRDDAIMFYGSTLGEITARDADRRRKLMRSERLANPPMVGEIGRFKSWAKSKGVDNVAIEVLFQDKGDFSGAISYKDGRYLLEVFEKADFSTIVHESAHLFMMDMISAVSEGRASDRVREDLVTLTEKYKPQEGETRESLLKELPYLPKDISNKDLSMRITAERMARGMEAYLREGKAPSKKLTRAFDTFKSWLMNIYKTFRELNVKMGDDVRQVFDRMFASQREIEDAKLFYEGTKELEEVLKAESTRKKKIAELRKEADNEGIRSRAAKKVNAYLRATGGRKQLRKEATKHVEGMEEYKQLKSIEDRGGIDAESLTDYLDADGVKALRRKHGRKLLPTKAEGISVGEAAIESGFDSVESYIAHLNELPKKSTAITMRTEALVDKQIDEFMEEEANGETIEGDTDYHSPTRLKLLKAEEQLLLEKVSKAERNRLSSLANAAYKQAAQNYINGERVDKATNWHAYARSEQKYAREAVEAAEKGDILAAHEAKKKQILNHILVSEAIKLRDYTKKVQKKYSASSFNKATKNIDPTLKDLAADLVHHYRLNASTAPKEARTSLNLGEVDESLGLLTPEWVQNKLLPKDENGAGWRALTPEQLRDLDATISRIIGFGSEQMLSFKSEQRQTFQQVKEEILENLKNVKDVASARYDRDSIPKILKITESLVSNYSRNQLIFERLDGWDFNTSKKLGVLGELDYQGGVVKEAENVAFQAEKFEQLAPHVTRVLQEIVAIEKKYGGKNFQLPTVPITTELENLGIKTWTGDRIFATLLNMGNQGNVDALKSGNGFTQEMLNDLASEFSDEAWDAIQGIWDVLETIYPEANRVHKSVYGVGMGRVEAQPFKVATSDGNVKEIRGGYYTRAYDPKGSELLSKGLSEMEINDKFRTENAMMMRKVKDDFTKERAAKPRGAIMLDPSLLYQHIIDTSRFITHAEYIRDMNRILKDKDIAREIRKKTGDKVFREIVESVKYQARPERMMDDVQSNMLDRMRRKATPVILGGSLSVPVKQRGSLLNTLSDIGWIATADGLLSMKLTTLTGAPVGEAFKKVESTFNFAKARNGYISQAQKEMRDSVVSKYKKRKVTIKGKTFTWENVVDLNFLWIRAQDRATTYPALLGAYNQYMRQHTEEAFDIRHENAVAYADTMARKQHPSALPADLNALQRNPGGAIKLFAVFMSYRMVHANRFIYNTKAMLDGKVPFNKWARQQFTEQYVMGMAMQAIGSFLGSGEAPDWFELFILGPLTNLISPIPLLSLGVSTTYSYLAKKDRGALDRATTTTAFHGFQKYLKAGKSTLELLDDKKEFSEVLLDYGKVVEYQTSAPGLSFINNAIRIADKLGDDKLER